MNKMTSEQLREAYVRFFENKRHSVIASASLIPENDPTCLFTTAGMHPLVPYLMGQKHAAGSRLVSVQKCVRTGDIDEVGDATHCTFFEMLGNWSLGDYFKTESINWSYEFLTDALGVEVKDLAVTCFEGDEDAPRDTVSAEIWENLGVPREKIFFLSKEHNWWGPAGLTGPCGADTEIFIDTGEKACGAECNPGCRCGKYVEIWNNVFMEYNKTAEGKYVPLKQKNVDTGMGLERTLCMLGGCKSVYETDLYADAIAALENLTAVKYGENPDTTKAMRVIADHVRTATFLLGDERGVTPSNVDQGYVLRRLIRRAVRYARQLALSGDALAAISEKFIDKYKTVYPELELRRAHIISELNRETEKFSKTIENGLKELNKVLRYVQNGKLNGKTAFRLYDTFGFPIEITVEICAEQGYSVDEAGYREAFAEHQKKSQIGAEQKFKGGLQDDGEATTLLHTATHLMLAALNKILGGNISQKGSNITAERLRFDFNRDKPLSDTEKRAVENYVNDAIGRDLPVTVAEMSAHKAKELGATGVFGDRYGEMVKVYTIGDISCEICGGPHAERTGLLGTFRILKEQSSSSGVRRIKATLIR